MLPPGAASLGTPSLGAAAAMPTMREIAIPLPEQEPTDPVQRAVYRLRDPVKVVCGPNGQEIVLRRLSPEEKAARRRKYNLFAALVHALVIMIAVMTLLQQVTWVTGGLTAVIFAALLYVILAL